MNLLNISKGLYSIGIRSFIGAGMVIVAKMFLLTMRKPSRTEL